MAIDWSAWNGTLAGYWHLLEMEERRMSCPTCDHTLQCVGQFISSKVCHWCPRCGTLQLRDELPARPCLVDRCRGLIDEVMATSGPEWEELLGRLGDLWHRTGIRESINVPAERFP